MAIFYYSERKQSRNIIKIFLYYSNNIPQNIPAQNQAKNTLAKNRQIPRSPHWARPARQAGGIDKPNRPHA